MGQRRAWIPGHRCVLLLRGWPAPPPPSRTGSTRFLRVPRPLLVCPSPLHASGTSGFCTAGACPPAVRPVKVGVQSPDNGAAANTWPLPPPAARPRPRTTRAHLDANQAFLPGVDPRQVDVFQGLPTEREVDPIWSHRELKGHGLMRFRHPGGWPAPGRGQEGAPQGSGWPRPAPRPRPQPAAPPPPPGQRPPRQRPQARGSRPLPSPAARPSQLPANARAGSPRRLRRRVQVGKGVKGLEVRGGRGQ